MDWVIWDWNGTLLDDAAVCKAVMDDMLRRRGLPPIPDMERYREIFTFPVRDYYALAGIDTAAEDFEALAEEYMTAYRARAVRCPLMPGAEDVLAALDGMGAAQILVSASRQDDLELQAAERGIAGRFRALLGVPDQLGGGKAGVAAAYMAREGIDPAEAIFVGDTLHDWEIAERLGSRCVLVAAGHQSRARLHSAGAPVLDTLGELPAFLAAQR